MKEFESLLVEVMEPVHASAARKRAMREELLAHLVGAYDEEFRNNPDAEAAAAAARQRFGDPDELRRRLQASVPMLDQLLAAFFGKEHPMSRWFWLVAWITVMIGFYFLFSRSFLPQLLEVTVIGGAGVWRLVQENNSVTRWLGPRWGWRIAAMLIGVTTVLPALGQVKQGRHTPAEAAGPVAMGLLFVLIGLVSAIHSLKNRRPQIA